jgi:uncharacterized protein (TIGR01777 family)
MNILITGGTGLIGRKLVNSLLLDGHQITILTRDPQKAKDQLPSTIQAIKWDGASYQGWGGIINQIDAVINLAGESIAGKSLYQIFMQRWSQERKNRISQSRIKIGMALSEAIRTASKKPDVLIQSSAVGYYGSRGPEKVIESSAVGNDYLAQVCLDWENSTASIEDVGVRRVIIRTGLVLDANDGILPVMLLPFKLFMGGPIGGGNQYIPWIHIQDQVDAIRYLATEENATGPYNLTAPNPVTNRDFSKIAGRVLRRPNWIPLPGFVLKLALGEKSTLILDGQRAIPQRLNEAEFKFKFEFLDKTLHDLVTD